MNAERRIPIVLVVVSLALVLLVPTGSRAQAGPARLSDVTVTPHPDSVTVFVKTSREAQYKADLVDSPSRLVIDLENTVYAWRKTPLNVGKDPVKQVRGGQYRQGVARLVLDLSRSVGYAIREESDGLAIVIPTAAPPAAVASSAAAAAGPGAQEAPPAQAARPVQIAQATPPAAPPAPTNGQRLISFDFKDADVVNLLRILAAESNKNVVIGDDVKGKMSITLKNVPWDLALDTILETRGLRKVEKDGVLRALRHRAPDPPAPSSVSDRRGAGEGHHDSPLQAHELDLHPPLRGGSRAYQDADPGEARRAAAAGEDRGAHGNPRSR